ncbi:hypothetical protein O9993_16435 [Vibrio lentus]|nr:hypothetical protein [Vibrio lentus]
MILLNIWNGRMVTIFLFLMALNLGLLLLIKTNLINGATDHRYLAAKNVET